MVAKFNSKDFAVWRVQTMAVLEANGLASVLGDIGPKEKVTVTHLAKDQKVKSLILLSLDNKYVKQVMLYSTAKEMWDKICSVHEHKSTGNRMVLQKQFFERFYPEVWH